MNGKPNIEIHTLEAKGGVVATIWQDTQELPGEPAFQVQRYSDGLLTIRQDGQQININSETVALLCKTLRNFSQI